MFKKTFLVISLVKFFYIKKTNQDIKEAIIAKHAKSHAYRAPPQLLTFNHMKNSEDSNEFTSNVSF